MRQSTKVPKRLPARFAWVTAVLLLGAPPAVAAQDLYRVIQQENFRREPRPTGRLLASVLAGTEVAGANPRDGWIQVTLDGWIWGASVVATTRDGFGLEVSARGGENLRAGPNGAILARLGQGFLLDSGDRDGDWIQVRRTGWMWGRSLQLLSDGTDPPRRPPVDAEPASPPPPVDASTYTVTSRTASVRVVPGGDSTMVVGQGTPVRVVERSGQWVRVHVEGWIHEDDIRPMSPDVLVGVSGAELRARPGDFVDKVVEWTVQYLALRTADELRQELPDGQPYMLARGPVPEAGFVYIMYNEDQADEISRLSPLAQVVITARVRVPRSRYLGNPVLELIDLSLRKP
jgi:SH3-like domain-containing protein